jgi:hypothetical protein
MNESNTQEWGTFTVESLMTPEMNTGAWTSSLWMNGSTGQGHMTSTYGITGQGTMITSMNWTTC